MLVFLLAACVSMPPERAARRALLEDAATECRRSFSIVIRVEVDPFDRLVAWYKENISQGEIEPFWQCVRDRLRQKAPEFGGAPGAPPGSGTPPLREPRIIGYYVNETKGFKVATPPVEWAPSLLRERPDQVADVAFERGGGYMVAAAFEMPAGLRFRGVNDWWVQTISSKWGWTDIKILEENDLKIGGFDAKVVRFEFSDRGTRRIDMTYHIWVPKQRYNLYRIRMTCAKDRCEEFLPAFQDFVSSFSFLF